MTTGIFAAAAAACVAGLFLARSRRDPVAWLTVYIVLLFGLSARWVLGPLGAVGQPAFLAGLLPLVWWVLARLGADPAIDREPRLVRSLIVAHAWFFLLSYAIGLARPLTATESSNAARTTLLLLSLVGVALLVADGVADRRRLDVLLRRLVGATAAVAGIGVLQFLTGADPWSAIHWPLLVQNSDVVSVGVRSAFNRPFSTTLHPIEFGVVVGAMLPLAMHHAFHRRPGGSHLWAWVNVGVIAAAVPMSVSRSAVLSAAVSTSIAWVRWSRRQRTTALIGASVLMGGVWMTVPGLLGTLLGLFSTDDPSVQARSDRIPAVLELWRSRPLLGRGFGTYNIEDYFLLDNQLLQILIDSGVAGVVVWVVVVVGISGALMAATSRCDPTTASLAGAIVAGIGGLFVSFATFDAFFYRILTGTLFLLLGVAGALHRMVSEPTGAAATAPGGRIPQPAPIER